jgi:hypothetical protein
MDLSGLKRDTAPIEAGEWIAGIPGMANLQLKVRGMTSTTFQTVFGRLARAVPKGERQRDGTLEFEAARRVLGEALHEAVLIDWSGLTKEGADLPFDAELAKTLLTDSAWQGFADAVVWSAGVVDTGRAETSEVLSKNSKPSSAGK